MKKAVKFSFTLHCRTAETEYKSERNAGIVSRTAETEYKSERNAGIVRGKLTNKEE